MTRFLLTLPFLVVLAACAVKKGPSSGPCPRTAYLTDAHRLAVVTTETRKNRAVEVVHMSAEIDSLATQCRLIGRDMAEVSLSFTLRAEKEGAWGDPRIELPYFIALLDANDQVIRQSPFTATVAFDDEGARFDPFTKRVWNKTAATHDIRIPFTSPAQLAKDKLVVGLVLAPEQLARNVALRKKREEKGLSKASPTPDAPAGPGATTTRAR